MNKSGFTFIEVLIAMAIAMVLILATMSQNLSIFKSQMTNVTRSDAAQDSLLEGNFFTQAIGPIGGGSVRSWMSVFIEDDCAARGPYPDCNHSDRMTTITANNPPYECGIQSSTKGSGPGMVLTMTPNCCLPLTTVMQTGQALMLVSNTFYFQVYSTAVDTAACTITTNDGQASVDPKESAPTGPGFWANGTAAIVKVNTYFPNYNAGAYELWQFNDANNDGVISPSEGHKIGVNVFDFQVELGFDIAGNNNLIDTESITDYWLYNAPLNNILPHEAFGAGAFVGASMSQLRMIGVGLMTGVVSNYQNTNSVAVVTPGIFDGPNRQYAGYELKRIILRSMPRNSYIFNK